MRNSSSRHGQRHAQAAVLLGLFREDEGPRGGGPCQEHKEVRQRETRVQGIARSGKEPVARSPTSRARSFIKQFEDRDRSSAVDPDKDSKLVQARPGGGRRRRRARATCSLPPAGLRRQPPIWLTDPPAVFRTSWRECNTPWLCTPPGAAPPQRSWTRRLRSVTPLAQRTHTHAHTHNTAVHPGRIFRPGRRVPLPTLRLPCAAVPLALAPAPALPGPSGSGEVSDEQDLAPGVWRQPRGR